MVTLTNSCRVTEETVEMLVSEVCTGRNWRRRSRRWMGDPDSQLNLGSPQVLWLPLSFATMLDRASEILCRRDPEFGRNRA